MIYAKLHVINLLKFYMKKYIDKAYKAWDKLPTPVKIIIYQTVALILNMAAHDLVNIETPNPYALLVLQMGANILLWASQYLIKNYVEE